MLTNIIPGSIVEKNGAQYRVLGTVSDVPHGMDVKALAQMTVVDYKTVPGVWLLLFLNISDARSVAVEGGEPPEKLHVTVAQIDPGDTSREIVTAAIEHIVSNLSPVRGKIGGYGQFLSDDDRVPVVALFDSVSLQDWRDELLETLKAIGVEVLSDHGYTPHITLAYMDNPTTPDVDDRELVLDTLSLVWEGDRQDFQLGGVGEKGGPGSGHWGHAGRPGEGRGGSKPGTLTGQGHLSEDYFKIGPGRKLLENLEPQYQDRVIEILTNERIQPWHLKNLSIIDDNPPEERFVGVAKEDLDEMGWPTVGEDRFIVGNYRHGQSGGIRTGPSSIHMRPETLTEEGFPGEESPGFSLVHELGHHVTMTNYLFEPVRSPHVGRGMQSVFNMAYLKASDIIRQELLGGKGTHEQKQNRLHERFSSMGLRSYSFTNVRELGADAFAVYVYGTPEQRANLAAFLQMPSMESVFYWEAGQE